MKRCVCVLGLKSPVTGVSNLNNNIRWRRKLAGVCVLNKQKNVLVSFSSVS